MDGCGLRFSIRPGDQGWIWATFDLTGTLQAEGRCESRRMAAAMVIREIILANTPALVQYREAA